MRRSTSYITIGTYGVWSSICVPLRLWVRNLPWVILYGLIFDFEVQIQEEMGLVYKKDKDEREQANVKTKEETKKKQLRDSEVFENIYMNIEVHGK